MAKNILVTGLLFLTLLVEPVVPVAAGPLEDGEAAYHRGDYATALQLIRPLADQGNSAAQSRLGLMYETGHGLPQDYTEALRWLRKAADHGNAKAQNNLGVMYENGQGVPSDSGEAAKWYRKAADQGFAVAQSNLGYMYYAGHGVPQDFAEAIIWYRKAGDEGDAIAQNNLGAMYEKGEGVAQDSAEAVKWYGKAAQQGYAIAQNSLGAMYVNGHGVSQNYVEAANWYRKAANQGLATAQNNLGAMYYAGQGVAQDSAEAVGWFRKAADQGFDAAQVALGGMYYAGHGVSQDYVEAMTWWRKAAEQGNALAQSNLVALYSRFPAIQIVAPTSLGTPSSNAVPAAPAHNDVTSNDASKVATLKKAEAVGFPDQEAEFCSIVEKAKSAYGTLALERNIADKQENGIRVEQIERNMTSVYRKRNEDIFRLVKRRMFSVDAWLVTVMKISSPIKDCHTNMPSCVFVDVHPLCSPTITLHVATAATPIQLQFLVAKQQGDQLAMSGMFVERFGGATAAASPVIPTSPEDFEGSFRESGSMSDPEYSIDVSQWK